MDPARKTLRRRAAGPLGSAALVCLVLMACASPDDDTGTPGDPAAKAPVRVPIREITLDLPLPLDRAEFSGLDWWGDRLVLLPQYPEAWGDGVTGALPTISRRRLESYLSGADTSAIVPESIVFDDRGLSDRVHGFDGYEAIAFDGDRAYLTIECLSHGRWTGVLVAARADADGRLVADELRRVEIPGASRRPNFSEEALVVIDGGVGSIHELNGVRVNATPRILRYDTDLRPLDPMGFPAIEYRVTDATRLDATGRLWIFNQFWPGEARVIDARRDGLRDRDRPPGRPIERIVPLRRVDDRFVVDATRAVVELVTRTDDVARNWEGIARWNDEGVLIVTDRHPRTVFAFVAWP